MTKLLIKTVLMTTFGEMYACNVKEARNLRFSVQLSFALWETLLDIFKGNANYTIYNLSNVWRIMKTCPCFLSLKYCKFLAENF